jgi:small subunit ribosomal protein S16
MVRIRLRRVGLKKQPSYRIVVIDQRNARNGKYIENIGHHNPRTEPPTDVIDEARALHWLGHGAQPTEAVMYILKRTGTWERYERMKKGESVEALVQEALAAQAEKAPVSPKTRYPSPAAGEGRKHTAEEAAS